MPVYLRLLNAPRVLPGSPVRIRLRPRMGFVHGVVKA